MLIYTYGLYYIMLVTYDPYWSPVVDFFLGGGVLGSWSTDRSAYWTFFCDRWSEISCPLWTCNCVRTYKTNRFCLKWKLNHTLYLHYLVLYSCGISEFQTCIRLFWFIYYECILDMNYKVVITTILQKTCMQIQ